MPKSIGIDPGLHTGLAISENRVMVKLMTTDFWGAIDEVKLHGHNHTTIYIEDPNINRPIFIKRGVFNGKNSETSEQLMLQKIAQNVGANKREASLLIKKFEDLGYTVIRCQPTKKSMTKMNSDMFNKLTGWAGRSSEHARDAGMLVMGR